MVVRYLLGRGAWEGRVVIPDFVGAVGALGGEGRDGSRGFWGVVVSEHDVGGGGDRASDMHSIQVQYRRASVMAMWYFSEIIWALRQVLCSE